MSLNERYREIYARLYGFKDHCDEQHHHVMRELEKELALRPEEQALSLLRQLVNLTEHFDDAVWYDKDNVRHPAVTPLVHTLAAEVRQYLDERQPQGERE